MKKIEKRRKYCLSAFSPFTKMFSKTVVLGVVTVHMFGKRLANQQGFYGPAEYS